MRLNTQISHPKFWDYERDFCVALSVSEVFTSENSGYVSFVLKKTVIFDFNLNKSIMSASVWDSVWECVWECVRVCESVWDSVCESVWECVKECVRECVRVCESVCERVSLFCYLSFCFMFMNVLKI